MYLIHVYVSGRAVLFKFKFVDQGKSKSFYAERPDRKNALGLYLCHMFTPFLLRIYVKREGGGVCNKAYNFCLAREMRLV
jgi:hypothetical protein